MTTSKEDGPIITIKRSKIHSSYLIPGAIYFDISPNRDIRYCFDGSAANKAYGFLLKAGEIAAVPIGENGLSICFEIAKSAGSIGDK